MKPTIVSHMPAMSIIARSMRFWPNISSDHNPLGRILATQNAKAVDQPARRQTRYPAMAMRMYNTPQTGPNSQFGGVNQGLIRPLYQTPGRNDPPKAPTASIARANGRNISFELEVGGVAMDMGTSMQQRLRRKNPNVIQR
jgi:hypothetical protein